MITTKQGEDAASYLVDVATSGLYLNNAFHVTRLDVKATLKEAKKFIKQREQRQKLGIVDKSAQRTFFPISLSQTLDDVMIAVDQKLSNPYRRIIEELFWFWPEPEGDPANDEALLYLSKRQPNKAKVEWVSRLISRQANIVPLHNLAVLHHLQALEIEREIRSGGCMNLSCPKCQEYFWVTADDSSTTGACPNCQTKLRIPKIADRKPDDRQLAELWQDAYGYWERLWISALFWAEYSQRAKDIDDILESERVEQIRQRLPEALLAINAKLAVDYCLNGEFPHALRQTKILAASKFSEKHLSCAIRHTTGPFIEQIHQQAELTEKRAANKPKSGLQEARDLLGRTRPALKSFEILNSGSLKLGYATFDAVATSALSALIKYQNETHDCESLIEPTEEIYKIAKSEALKERVLKNLGIIRDILQEKLLQSQTKPLVDLCEEINQAVSALASDDRSGPYSLYQRFQNEVSPMLNELRTRFGEEGEAYKQSSDICAFCLRGISISLHNNCSDMGKALDAIKWALNLCQDPKLRDMLAEDLQICRRNSLAKRKHKNEEFIEKLKWAGAVVLVIGGLIVMGNSDKGSSGSVSNSRSYSTNQPSVTRSNRSNLNIEIDLGRSRLRQIESQLSQLKQQLANYETSLNNYERSGQSTSYNNLVPIYNSLLERGKSLYAEYQRLLIEVNAKIDRYNSGN